MAAVRSPIGSALQFSALAFATSRLNWSCPLKTVLNGNRDSYANATEQIDNMGTKTFQVCISPTTQRGIALQSTRVSGLVFNILPSVIPTKVEESLYGLIFHSSLRWRITIPQQRETS